MLVIALQVPSVQQFTAQKATNYLSKTLNAKVSIGRFTTDWRNSLVLKDIYLEDQHQDTLVYAERLGLDLNIFGLLNSKISLSSGRLDNAVVNISSTMPDSIYNFDFILKAFATDTTQTPPADTAAAFTYDIGVIELNKVRFTMADQVGGNNVKANIGHFTVTVDAFDLTKAIYQLGKASLENSTASFIQTKIPPETSSDSITLDMGFKGLALKKVKFNYQNVPASQRIVLDVGASELTARKIDLKNARIDLGKFNLENSYLAYFQDPAVPTDSLAVNPAVTAAKLDSAAEKHQGEPVNWVVNLGDLQVKNVNLDFGNQNQPAAPQGMDFNHLKVTGLNIDLQNLLYSQDKIAADLKQLQLKEKSGFKITNFQADVNVGKEQASLRNFDLKTGYSHLRPTLTLGYPSLTTIGDNVEKLTIDTDLENSVVGAQDILYFAPFLANNPSFQKLMGRDLTLDGRLYGKVSDLNAENLRVKGLVGTRINISGNIKEITNLEKGAVNLQVNELTTTRTDLLALLPKGTIPADITLPQRMTISGRIRGKLDNLELQNFKAAASGGTFLAVSGNVQNASDPKKLRMNLDVNNFTSTRTALLEMLPKGTVPPNIQLPEKMQLSGRFKGTLQNFDSDANIKSSFGNAVSKVSMRPGEQFNGTANLAELNLGKLLKQEQTLGKTTGKVTFSGTGLTPETMRARFNADIQKFEYNKYAYNNINLSGSIDRQNYNLTGNMKDGNLAFNLDGNFNLAGTPTYKATLNLEGANLKALNLYSEDIKVSGKVGADLKGASPDEMQGTVNISNLLLQKGRRNYRADTVAVQVANAIGKTDINIQSDVISGFFRGNNSLSDLAVAIPKHIDAYFNLQDAPYPANINLQNFEFNFDLKRPRILTAFVPGLKRVRPGKVSGSYNTAGQDLKLDANLPKIVYMNYTVDSTKLQVRGDAQKIGYNLSVEQLLDSTIHVKKLSLAGNIQDDKLGTNLKIAEDNGATRFGLGGIMNVIPNGYRFSFTPGEVILNQDPWEVSGDNYIQYQNGSVYANNILLGKNGSQIAVNSLGNNTNNAPMEVKFTNFELVNISRVIERDDSLIAGTVNGTLVLRDLMKTMGISSDVAITNLAYTGVPIGDLKLQASNTTGNRYNLLATLSGNGNNASVSGYYVAQGTSNALNLNANIQSLNVAIIQGFSNGQLKNMGGNVSGNLSITGTVQQPNVRGIATFTDATFALAMYDATYKLQNERIVFDERGINFSNFTLLDPNNNKAVVNGTILTQNYTDFRFNLDATTDHFLLINSDAADYKLYYGKAVVDSNIKIRGNFNVPVVTADVTVVDGSDITIVIPAAAVSKQEQEGIVQFQNMHRRRRPTSALLEERQDSVQELAFTGFDASATVTVTDKTKFAVIIDETTGDKLEVTGNGTLNAGVDPAGNITLTGRYDVAQGSYKLYFYDIASRELRIDKGSSITWYGDPLDATVDIRAIYDVQAPVRELVAEQIAGETGTEQNKYRQQLPFQVYVNLNGNMLKPDITFDIQLPEAERGAFAGQIDQRLQMLRSEPSEMNKQVFSLIVLGRFMAPDPLQSSGGGLQETARASLSAALGEQLNQLTNKYAGGLGLELGLNAYQDYSTGNAQNRTDLNVAVRQELMNDRLIFRVGTDIGLEGKNPASPAANRSNSNTGFAGDFSIEYLILPDGRLRVRGFQNPSYEILTESQLQETGVALVYQRDFNDFAELFRRVSKAQEKARQQQQARN